MNDQLKECKNL